jgi:hypothetical protein
LSAGDGERAWIESDAADIYAAKLTALVEAVEALRRFSYLHGLGSRDSRRQLGQVAKALQHIAENDRESSGSEAAG